VKWVKRRPAVAALLAVTAAAALCLAVGVLVHNARLGVALRDAEDSLEKAERADREKTRQLAIALLREAQALRNSGQVGRRFEGLEALKRAGEHFQSLGRLDPERTLELRNEAIACLVLADLRPGRGWPRDPVWSPPLRFDPTLRYYVVCSPYPYNGGPGEAGQGRLSVRRVADDQEVARLPGFGVRAVWTQFSPDGRYLAVHYEWGPRHNYVWDLSRREAVVKVSQGRYESHIEFSPDSRLAALARPNHSIRIYELPSGAAWKDLPPALPVNGLQFHPDGRRVTAACGDVVVLRDLDGKEVVRFQAPAYVKSLAWRGDGKLLATGCMDNHIYLWDPANPTRPLRTLTGHFGAVVNLAFSHGGDLLVSGSWDSTTRLWDPMTGQLLLSKPEELLCQFGPNDLGLDHGWQLAPGRECRTFHGARSLKWVAVSPGGRLLASASEGGVQLWDLAAAREGDKELATLPVGVGARAHFDPKGESLITDGSRGLQRWPIAPDPATGGLRVGPPEPLGLSARAPLVFPGYDPQFALSADGRRVAHGLQLGRVLLFDLEAPRRRLLIESPCLRAAAFSPDGRWLATGNWQGQGVKVWDARTGELAHDFDFGRPEEGAAWPAFSPDGKWLVTGSFAEYRFWEVGSWRKRHGLPRASAGRSIGRIAFSPDSRVLAVLHGVSGVRLLDPATGRPFAHLPGAGSPYCFSPDGSLLVTHAGRTGDFQVWDLRRIRRQLWEMDLDWDLPPYPPPCASAGPLRVQVLAAERPPHSTELDAQAHLERGLLYVLLRRYAAATADFIRAGKLDPKRPPWEEVVRAYAQAIERNPQDAEAYYRRAHAYGRLGRWEKALDDQFQAIKRGVR
jgi:WD40 repeat protein